MRRAQPALALLLLAACAPRSTDRGALAFRDAEGHPVAGLTLPVRRVVSTMQSATEWLVALGAESVLVARTDFDHQPDLQRLPSIGGGLDPSAEVVAQLRPDVVIGWESAASLNLQHALAPFHIPVIALATRDTADLFAGLGQLGVLVGAPSRADSLANALRHDLRQVRTAACDGGSATRDSVLVVIGTDPPQTTGGDTWLDTLLEAACLANVFGDLAEPWPSVSMEAITARQPRWLLMAAGGTPGAALAALRARPGWRELDAVREGRLLELPADLLSRAGPTMADAARALAAVRQEAGGH